MKKNIKKLSHHEAILNAKFLKEVIENRNEPIEIDCFVRDIQAEKLNTFTADVIITDLPYGILTNWKNNEGEPITNLLDNLYPNMKPGISLLALIFNKKIKLNSPYFQKVDHFKIGKRYIYILRCK